MPPHAREQSISHAAPSAGPGTPTAQDLLHNLMIGGNNSPAQLTPTMPSLPRQTSQPASAKESPGMLFGGDANGSSIWTMTRAESGRGGQRSAAPGQGVNLANIWNDQPSPSAHQAGGSQPSLAPIGTGAPGQDMWTRAGGLPVAGGAEWGAPAYTGSPAIGGPGQGDRKTSATGWNGGWNGQPAGYPR